MKARSFARIAFDFALFVACIIALLIWPLRVLRTVFQGSHLNSLWIGTPIINMATNAKAERMLGINSKTLVYETYFITNAFDYDLSRWKRIPVIGHALPLLVFIWACYYADRFHFYSDRGILPSRGHFTFDYVELYIYKILHIPVFLWTYGADVRNRQTCQEMGEPNCCTNCDNPGAYCICDQKAAFHKMERLKSLSMAIFAGIGDMFGYTPGSRDDLYFWPVDLEAEEGKRYSPVYLSPNDNERPLRIVHASNHRRFKGTGHLIEAVRKLSAEGINVELVLVEGVPNHEALNIYRSADIIFDQCLMGNYGYFALEAMALGKPVMCFIRKPEEYLLHPEECPIININTATLQSTIQYYATNGRNDLADIGKNSRIYIERFFSMEAFAQRLKKTYTDLGIEY